MDDMQNYFVTRTESADNASLDMYYLRALSNWKIVLLETVVQIPKND